VKQLGCATTSGLAKKSKGVVDVRAGGAFGVSRSDEIAASSNRRLSSSKGGDEHAVQGS